MANSTQLQMVNRVMRRLREPEVATVSESIYSQLIADFLNQIIVEVGDFADWTQDMMTVIAYSLSQPAAGPVSLSKNAYYLLNKDTQYTTRRSRPELYRGTSDMSQQPSFNIQPNTPKIACFADASSPVIYSENAQYPTWLEPERMSAVVMPNVGPLSYTYEYFSYTQNPATDGWQLILEPRPDFYWTCYTYWYVPEEPLEVDGTDDSTVMRYDAEVLFLGTLWLALNERGEEMGEPGNMPEDAYKRRLTELVEKLETPKIMDNKYEAIPD